MNLNAIQRLIVKEFTDAGYQPHQIAGVLSAVQHESSGNSRVIGDAGNSAGLFQFNGPRRQALVRMFGNTASSPLAQIRYALHELNTTERRAGDMLRAAKNPLDAAIAMNNFERFSARGGYRGGPEATARMRSALNFDNLLRENSPTQNALTLAPSDNIARSLSDFETPEVGSFDMASLAPKVKARVPKVKGKVPPTVANSTEEGILKNVPGLTPEEDAKRALDNQTARPDKGRALVPYEQGQMQPKQSNVPTQKQSNAPANFDQRFGAAPGTAVGPAAQTAPLASAAATMAAALGIPMAAIVPPTQDQQQQQPATAPSTDPAVAQVQSQVQAAPSVSPETEAFAQKIMQAIVGDPQTAAAADGVAKQVTSNIAAQDAGVPLPQSRPNANIAQQQQMDATANQRAAADQGMTGDSPEMMYAVNRDNGAGGNMLLSALMQALTK